VIQSEAVLIRLNDMVVSSGVISGEISLNPGNNTVRIRVEMSYNVSVTYEVVIHRTSGIICFVYIF